MLKNLKFIPSILPQILIELMIQKLTIDFLNLMNMVSQLRLTECPFTS